MSKNIFKYKNKSTYNNLFQLQKWEEDLEETILKVMDAETKCCT